MKKFQKYKLISFALLLLSSSIINASGVELEFGESIQSGNSLAVDVLISGLGLDAAPSVSAFDLNIVFDNLHLSFNSATFGNQLDIFDLGLNFTDASLIVLGDVNIYEVSLDEAADLNDFQADSFTLATLVFDILKSDSSQLSFVVNDLGDAAGNYLDANLLSSTVTTVPVPAAVWLFVSAVGGLGFSARRKREV